MLKLEMLQAGQGDCLQIEYGDPKTPRRLLIDGGAAGTYKRALRDRLRALSEEERRFELLVVTHIDADHITGILDLSGDSETHFQPKDIWFNGYRHLPDEKPETLGPVRGELLTDVLVKRPRDNQFKKAAVVVQAEGDLPCVEFEGGLVMTLLSPVPEKLADLKPN